VRTTVIGSLVFLVASSTTVLVGSLALASCGGGAPRITDFVPKTARVGVPVTITGKNLGNASAVTFGGGPPAPLGADTATEIVATVPAGSASGVLSVTTPSGTDTMGGFSFTPPAPTITGFIPTTGPVRTSVTITGTNFTGATAVTFNGTAAPFVVDSATQITATTAAGTTTGPVSVRTPDGTAVSSGSFRLRRR
jgi:hypothetical protein